MKELATILRSFATVPSGILATLVKVEGSSYRRVGARLYWHPDHGRVGSISGGCLEEDLLLRARAVLSTGESEVVVYDTTSENDLVWGVGLGCHGIVHVLLEHVTNFPLHWQLLARAWERREAVVLVTAFGPSPHLRRSLLAVNSSGALWRDSPELPSTLLDQAQACLASQASRHTTLAHAGTHSPVLCEYLPPPLRLVLLGAGDDAIPVCRLAKELGWRVTIVDPRAAFATAARFPSADEIHALPAEETGTLSWDPLTVAVIMTHHYRFDLPMLRAVLPLPLSYVGLLGPKKRGDKLLGDLAAEGLTITPEMRARLHAPVGLDLGASAPEEVAFAIIAEIQAVLNSRDARPLRERIRPIHG